MEISCPLIKTEDPVSVTIVTTPLNSSSPIALIEGILLTMFDSRLRLSNQVVEEVKKHFGDIVFSTIIQRNIKLGEAPGFGKDIITYDVTSKGTKNYLSLANEVIKKNKDV